MRFEDYMDERNGHHISPFIYPECAKQLLRQFRFKSKEEVQETVEYVLEAGDLIMYKPINKSKSSCKYKHWNGSQNVCTNDHKVSGKNTVFCDDEMCRNCLQFKRKPLARDFLYGEKTPYVD